MDHSISCHAFKLSIGSEQDAHTTMIFLRTVCHLPLTQRSRIVLN
ncbi:hypothetical protein [Coleofasciculus sp.]